MLRKLLWKIHVVPVMLLLAGCAEKTEPTPLTYSQLLTGKEKKVWKMTVIEILDEGAPPSSGGTNQFFPTCIADDYYVFYANAERRFEATEGATKCSPNDPDVYVEGSWAIINATATLEFPLPVLTGNQAVPFVLKELTANKMVIEYYFIDINASYRFTFEAQSGG